MSKPTVAVRSSGTGLNWVVSFAYDRALVAAIKALPQHARRFDKRAVVWRVDSSHIRDVIETAQRNGHSVITAESVVALGEIRDGQLVVDRCPWCHAAHRHGLGDEVGAIEHRVAHCAGRHAETRAYAVLVRRHADLRAAG